MRRRQACLVVLSVSLFLDDRFKLLVEIVFLVIFHLHRFGHWLRWNDRLAHGKRDLLELLDLHVTLFVLGLELVELFREIGSRFLKLECRISYLEILDLFFIIWVEVVLLVVLLLVFIAHRLLLPSVLYDIWHVGWLGNWEL